MAPFSFELLGPHHDRAAFSCGNPALDDYLWTKARKERDLGYCSVVVMVEGTTPSAIAGYYTLSAHTLDISALDDRLRTKMPKYPLVPVTLLGRLARASHMDGRHAGETMLMHALAQSARSAATIGSHAVVVDAIDDRASEFYRRYGFIAVKSDARRLYLPMETIRKLDLNVP